LKIMLEVPETLIHKAMNAAKIRSKSRSVTLAVKNLIKNAEIGQIKNYAGKVEYATPPPHLCKQKQPIANGAAQLYTHNTFLYKRKNKFAITTFLPESQFQFHSPLKGEHNNE